MVSSVLYRVYHVLVTGNMTVSVKNRRFFVISFSTTQAIPRRHYNIRFFHKIINVRIQAPTIIKQMILNPYGVLDSGIHFSFTFIP